MKSTVIDRSTLSGLPDTTSKSVSGRVSESPRGPRHVARWKWSLRRLSGAQQAVALTLTMTLINLSWALRDHAAPSWDQSHYLYLTWVYQQALDHHGPAAFLHAVYTTDPSRSPLLSVLMVPLSYIFGPGTAVGLALNLTLLPIFLLCTGAIAKAFFDSRARLLAIVFLAPMPLIVSLLHQVLQDFLLVTLTAAAVLLLLKSNRFQGRKASFGLGLVVAAGMLTKFSFFLGIAGPVIVTLVGCIISCVASRRRDGNWRAAQRPITNIGLLGVIAVVPTLLWYLPNWNATATYLKTQFSIQAGGTLDPLSPLHVAAYLIDTGENMSWLAVAIAISVCAISLPRLAKWLTNRQAPGAAVFRAAFLGSWFLIPILLVSANVNQDPRYLVASYPALAVIIGGLISEVTLTLVRWVLVTAIVISTVIQIGEVDIPHYETPLLPAAINVHVPGGLISIPTRGGEGPAVVPDPENVTLEILEYIESRSRGPDGQTKAADVVLPELEPTANGNDLSYYAAVRHDPFTFVTLEPSESRQQLTASLQGSNFVLYVRQEPIGPGVGADVVSQLNQSVAARQLTPAMFALFSTHPQYIYIGADALQSPYLAILERRES